MARSDGEWWLEGLSAESEPGPATPARSRVLDSALALSVFFNCVALSVNAFVEVPLPVWLGLLLLIAVTFTARAVVRRSLW
jgi:hypothetical protein